jgi:hypothetical protein
VELTYSTFLKEQSRMNRASQFSAVNDLAKQNKAHEDKTPFSGKIVTLGMML